MKKTEILPPDFYFRVPCVVKLALEAYLEKWPESIRYQVNGARDEESLDEPQMAKVICSLGYGRYETYCKCLGEDYENPYREEEKSLTSKSPFAKIRFRDERFHLLGAVAMVFLVDKRQFQGETIPQSFRELAEERFYQKICYTDDQEMLNKILLPLFGELYGEELCSRFRKNLTEGMHPSQMCQRGNYKSRDSIYIMPYFFASLKAQEKDFVLVWPEEGAFAIPIFLTAQKEAKAHFSSLLQKIKEKELAEILSAEGSFPSSALPLLDKIPGDLLFLSSYIKTV